MNINAVDHARHESDAKAKGGSTIKRLIGKLREMAGKAVSLDEDWIFKSKDWPYLWRK